MHFQIQQRFFARRCGGRSAAFSEAVGYDRKATRGISFENHRRRCGWRNGCLYVVAVQMQDRDFVARPAQLDSLTLDHAKRGCAAGQSPLFDAKIEDSGRDGRIRRRAGRASGVERFPIEPMMHREQREASRQQTGDSESPQVGWTRASGSLRRLRVRSGSRWGGQQHRCRRLRKASVHDRTGRSGKLLSGSPCGTLALAG